MTCIPSMRAWFACCLLAPVSALYVASPPPRTLLRSRPPLAVEDGASVADIAQSVDEMPDPTTDLERQQFSVIKTLMQRVGMDESTSPLRMSSIQGTSLPFFGKYPKLSEISLSIA